MSILWGITKEPGATVRNAELLDLAVHTRLYATCEPAVLTCGRVGLGLQLYRSHSRSEIDSRPFSDGQGNILCFDGRLDNFRELCELLRLDDVAINGVDDLIRTLDRDRIDRELKMDVLRMGRLREVDIHPIERRPVVARPR